MHHDGKLQILSTILSPREEREEDGISEKRKKDSSTLFSLVLIGAGFRHVPRPTPTAST